MQSHQFSALKRSAAALCGQRAALAQSFTARIDELVPGLGARLQGGPAEELVTAWTEAARCAQRWQNVQPLLDRSAAELTELGVRSREYEVLLHAWMSTLQDALDDRLDDDLREAWRTLLNRFISSLREAGEGQIGRCETLA